VHSRGGAYTFTVSGTDIRQRVDFRRPADAVADALRVSAALVDDSR